MAYSVDFCCSIPWPSSMCQGAGPSVRTWSMSIRMAIWSGRQPFAAPPSVRCARRGWRRPRVGQGRGTQWAGWGLESLWSPAGLSLPSRPQPLGSLQAQVEGRGPSLWALGIGGTRVLL